MNKDNLPDIGTVAIAEIHGLSIRYAKTGVSKGIPILLTAPWPESIYAFHRVAPRLAVEHPVILVDLPGFGLSQSRPDVMAPEAMGDFLIKLLKFRMRVRSQFRLRERKAEGLPGGAEKFMGRRNKLVESIQVCPNKVCKSRH